MSEEKNVDENIKGTDLWKALNNGGWTDRRIAAETDYSNSRKIYVHKASVSEFGTYRVNIEFTAKENIEDMTLFAGRRNMVMKGITLPSGERFNKSFYVAVTPYIPALTSKRYDDKTIYISWTHADSVDFNVSVVKEDVPIIWVAGDSTLTDQNAGIPYYPYGSCAGWAQTLSRFTEKAAVCNLAHSGMTSNCFRDDGHYDIAKEMMKPGDLFIIQFGHNDQKRRNLQPFDGYKDNIKKYVQEVRELGATPIICSPISRVPSKVTDEKLFKECESGWYSLLLPYRNACEEASKELDVSFIDLHEYTFKKWIEFGDNAKDYFIPGDITHTNEYGALLIADYFVQRLYDKNAIREVCKCFDKESILLARETEYYIKDEEKQLPKEQPGPDIFGIEPPFVDIRTGSDKDSSENNDSATELNRVIPEYEGIRKAFKYGLLDPCVMYLHPYAIMPRAQLLMVLFKAFKLSGKRPYQNRFNDITNYDWDAGYIQTLIDEDIIDESTIGLKHNEAKETSLLFRPDDPLTYEELASFIIRFMEKNKEKRRSLSLEYCLKKATEIGIIQVKESVNKEDENLQSKLTGESEDQKLYMNEKYPIASGKNISRAEVYASLARYIDLAGNTAGNIPDDVDVHPVH